MASEYAALDNGMGQVTGIFKKSQTQKAGDVYMAKLDCPKAHFVKYVNYGRRNYNLIFVQDE